MVTHLPRPAAQAPPATPSAACCTGTHDPEAGRLGQERGRRQHSRPPGRRPVRDGWQSRRARPSRAPGGDPAVVDVPRTAGAGRRLRRGRTRWIPACLSSARPRRAHSCRVHLRRATGPARWPEGQPVRGRPRGHLGRRVHPSKAGSRRRSCGGVSSPRTSRSSSVAGPDVEQDPVRPELGPREDRVDDVRRSVETAAPARRPRRGSCERPVARPPRRTRAGLLDGPSSCRG